MLLPSLLLSFVFKKPLINSSAASTPTQPTPYPEPNGSRLAGRPGLGALGREAGGASCSRAVTAPTSASLLPAPPPASSAHLWLLFIWLCSL